MSRTLILGAGFGGLAAATQLARELPAGHEVALVDERDTFVMGLAKLGILDGRATRADHERRLQDIEHTGASFIKGTIQRIDHEAKRVELTSETLPYDQLILALGAKLGPVPEGAHNLYSVGGVEALHKDLARTERGDVLFAVTSLPFKCPPAPYEASMLAKSFLDKRGVAARVAIASPEPQPMPAAGPTCGAEVSHWLEERGVARHNNTPLDAALELPHDILAVVPAHLPPPVLGAWMPADAATLATTWPDVWAIGDCNVVTLANGKPLVKAGVMAEGEGKVVASNIAARIRGEPETARFDGKGGCFLELGGGLAVEVVGDFYATPAPIVAAKPPSKATLEAKKQFEAERLAAWFGA